MNPFYRIKTILKSLWALYKLPPEKVQSFLDAYEVFETDWKSRPYDDKIKQSLIDYYSVVNHLCTIAKVEKMYIPPAIDLSRSFFENQELFEKKMARDLGAKKGDNILEIGCGRGRIAAHVVSLTGAHLTGINIDDTQLNVAREHAEKSGLSGLAEFKYGDLNKPFEFPDASFDAIYNVQAFSYSENLPALFREIYRVLKPSGRFALLEYVLKKDFDPNNPKHQEMLRKTKQVLAAVGSPTIADYEDAMRQAGFNITESHDPSINGQQAPLIEKSLGKWVSKPLHMGLLPGHFQTLFERLARYGDVYVEADKMGLLTTSWYIAATKPANP